MTADLKRAEQNARMLAAVERARAGDTSALELVVREFNPLLWHVARSQGLNSGDAADVVQTVWLVFVSKLDKIRNAEAISGWLITVTKREAWRVTRGKTRTVSEERLAEVPSTAPELDHQLLSDQRDQTLWRCVRKLSQRCQALLRVVAVDHRPDYQQLSKAMGMPTGSIGPTRGRCLTKLRELLLADPGWAS